MPNIVKRTHKMGTFEKVCYFFAIFWNCSTENTFEFAAQKIVSIFLGEHAAFKKNHRKEIGN